MPGTPLEPESPGLFGSVLDWISTPGYAVRNILKGNFAGALKNAVDNTGDILDAVLPGDWIPHLSGPEDRPQTSDVQEAWGATPLEPGFGKFAMNLVGDTLTDPWTYIPGANIAGIGGRLAKGVEAGVQAADKIVPGVAKKAQTGLLNTKSVMGWLEPQSELAQKTLADAEAAKSLHGKASLTGAQQLLNGLDEPTAKLMTSVIENYKPRQQGFGAMVGPLYDELLPGSETLNAPQALANQLKSQTELANPTVRNVVPSTDYLQVKQAGSVQPIDELSKQVGVEGVANPGAISMGTPGDMTGGLSFVHQMMDDAATATREHFPLEATDPRFASGIDVANQQLVAPGRGLKGIEKFGPEQDVIEKTPATTRTTSNPYTGQPTTKEIVPRTVTELPVSNTQALSALQGGSPAEMAAVAAEDLPRSTKPMVKLDDQLDQWNRRIDSLSVDDAQKAKLKEAAPRYLQFIHNNFVEKVKDLGALSQRPGDDVLTMIPQDYAHRMFTDLKSDSLKGRTLTEGQDLRDFMNANQGTGVQLEHDLLKSTTDLAAQQGRIAQRATVAKGLLGDEYVSLADKDTGGKVTEAIDAMRAADPEGAKLLDNAWNGLEARGPLMETLSKANAVFKPAAVYGIAFPKVGGIMKNILSFPVQLALQGEYKQAGLQAWRTPQTIVEAMRQGVNKAFGLQIAGDKLAQGADLMEQAFKQGGGRAKNVTGFLRAQGREDLAQAVEHGVADGFVSREAVEDSIRNSSWGKRAMGSIGLGDKAQARAFDLLDAPASAFQGAEQYARLGSFLDLMKRGKSPAEAAKTVRGALYDYGVKTGGNRTLRDIIPFAAYQTNAIRQSAKAITAVPALGVVAAGVMGGDHTNPLYPYMEGKTNIPIGADAEGNQTYLTNLGLPPEALNSLPNPSADLLDFGRDIKRKLVGSSQPLLKTSLATVFGQDPYFETPFGEYSNVAGHDLGAFGRTYNVLNSTGLTTPVTSQIGQFSKFFDDKGTLASDIADFATGANAVSVNEDQAIQQQLQQVLQHNPNVQKAVSLYQRSPDPQTQELLKALREAKKRAKDKKELAKAQ